MSKKLSLANARELAAKVEWEGDLSYVLKNWEFKEEFKDSKFTELRASYLKSLAALEEYCGLHRVEEEE